MFMGEYSHSLDGKGRLIIPSKFREALGDRFVITRSLDPCLCIYTMEDWEKLDSWCVSSSPAPMRRKPTDRDAS